MKKVIIYPGRFQPMLSHHATVFERLIGENPDHEVYIATSDKVEPDKSPFNFKEKQLIASGHGIDPNRVLFARSPYNNVELAKYFDEENTEIFFAVGEKDMETDPRFTFNNLDKDGINIKQNGEPYYYQMINTYKDNPMPMNKRGYIMVVPTISGEEEVASASSFRNAIKTAPNKESAREIFSKQFKEYKDNIFELVYDKIKGDKMSEDLNILRQLAGLSVSEDAPIEFKSQLKPEEIKFAPVSKSSAVMSIANRFPQGADVNDSEVKKDEFVKALVSSPVSLLSEINERIMPDENGLEVSKRLSEILDKMPEDGLASLDDSDKGFVLDIVKVALKDMELSAGDEREFDPETSELESIDLSDVREDYGIEEQEELNEIRRNIDSLFVYSDGQPLSYTDWFSEWTKETGNYNADSEELVIKRKYDDYVLAVKRARDYRPPEPVQMDLGFDKDDHAKTFRKMMGRTSETTESQMNEGGSAADLAMTDSESWIEQCSDAEECIQGLEDLKSENPSDADESYANDIIDTYIDMVQNFGLEDVQDKLEADKNNEPDLPESIKEGDYANYVMYIGPNGEHLGTEDYDGELESDMMSQMVSDEECKMLCDKHNIDHDEIVGCLKFDKGEATTQDGEELPDGTHAFYGGKDETNLKEFKGTSDVDLDEMVADAMAMTFQEFIRAYPDYKDIWLMVQEKIKSGSLADLDMYDSVDTSQYRAIVEEIQLNESIAGWLLKGAKVLKDAYKGVSPGTQKMLQWTGGLSILSGGVSMFMNTVETHYKELLALILGGTAIYELIRRMGEKRETARQVAAEFDLRMKEKNLALNDKEKVEMANELKRLAYQGANESFDPRMEPSRDEQAMNHVADGDFGQAAFVLGDTSKDAGDNLMAEWSEYCALRGLDQKDTLNDFDHVERFIDEIVGSMDDPNYPAEMESIDKQIAEYNELRKLSGLSTLEEQLEGIELLEDDGDLPGKGAGENRGRHIGKLVGIGLSFPVALKFLRNLMIIIKDSTGPHKTMYNAFKVLFTNPAALTSTHKLLIFGAGWTAIGLPVIYKLVRWASETFGGMIGKTFDIKADPEQRKPVMASKEVHEDSKSFNEASCVKEMKKLYASGCTKESMYSKVSEKYGCSRKKFEELYEAHCNESKKKVKCPKCGADRIMLKACATCGCS